MNTFSLIEQSKLIVICRRIYGQELIRLADALYQGGVRLMEMTFDQADPDCIKRTAENIYAVRKAMPEEMKFGAGTVLTEKQILAAGDAGAEYIISPNTNAAIIRATKEAGLLSIPGAMTPSEIISAHEAGADMVKLFPASYLGLSYIKDIKAPIPFVRLCAAGGITEENAAAFLKGGMDVLAVGGRLADRKCIAEGNYPELTQRAKEFVRICCMEA